MHEPDTPIVTLISLKETGPAVFCDVCRACAKSA